MLRYSNGQDQLDVWEVRLEAGNFTEDQDDEAGAVWTPVAQATSLTLAPHGTAVCAHPGPTGLNTDDDDDNQHLRHQTRNTRFLAGLGFVPFQHQLWTLDLSAGHAAETLAQLRRAVRY